MTIPKGKQIIIKKNSDDILPGITLTLDTEMTLSLQSHFQNLIDNAQISTMASAISGTIKSTTGTTVSAAFKQAGYQTWTGTDPLTFAFSTTLNMKTSGKTDVLEPAKTLMNLCLPVEASDTSGGGFGLQGPGPSVYDTISSNTSSNSAKYSFRCGIVYLPMIVITKAEPTFADEIDDEGYPIWCTINMEVSSVYTATTHLINNFGVSD